jgi:hypothetical protein
MLAVPSMTPPANGTGRSSAGIQNLLRRIAAICPASSRGPGGQHGLVHAGVDREDADQAGQTHDDPRDASPAATSTAMTLAASTMSSSPYSAATT